MEANLAAIGVIFQQLLHHNDNINPPKLSSFTLIHFFTCLVFVWVSLKTPYAL